ncbi:Blastula protease 10 [Amphibalanus amphitrite]|uniref:Metalloendopeptidase n=1 Tax=Amphibalanus amphitrite TaxID=1232801 RepID=A0A6A4V9F9_AMPAM|nr:Blastula protease 10 [Amphibalanus amphitrite]
MAGLHRVLLLSVLAVAVEARPGRAGQPEPPPVPPFRLLPPLNVTLPDGTVRELFEGDILLSKEQRLSRKGLLSQTWTNGVVPFVITSSSSSESSVILAAIAHWEAVTCITFQQKPESYSGGPHVRFIKSDGCWSAMGMTNSSSGQLLSVGDGCQYLGVVAHEIGHAIGFFHEQSRGDRGSHVTVVWDNIKSDMAFNFRIETAAQWLGVPYDLGSLMHYGGFGFTSNGFPTIVTNDILQSGLIGNLEGLSHRDKHLASLMYLCDDSCSSPPTCANGGYVDSSCTCVCPPGTSGVTCQTVTGTYYEAPCGDQDITTAGAITSPDYPNLYPPGQHCVWVVTAPAGKRVRIQFGTFKILYRYDVKCPWDWVTVHTDSDSIPDYVNCGTELQNAVITSSGGRLALEFHSYGGGSYPTLQSGFTASVTFV